ncbi:MAG: Flp family type IVb pilin [Anaerolineae bacterium]
MHRLTELLQAVHAIWNAALAEKKAQGLVEYALILMFVAIAVIVILALLGPAVGNIFSNVINQL